MPAYMDELIKLALQLLRRFLLRDDKRAPDAPNAVQSLRPAAISDRTPVSDSARVLGERLRFIRTEVLKANPILLARIVGCPRGTDIERYEAGLEELPKEYRAALVSRLFIDRDFLEGTSDHVFRRFRLGFDDECHELLEAGFKPYLLCAPPGEDEGLAYVLFHKSSDGWAQLVASDRCGNFYSSGGGRQNLCSLASAVLHAGSRSVPVLSASHRDWDALNWGRFYTLHISGPRTVNTGFQDLWDDLMSDCNRRCASR
jgi:hypothetical protein